MSRWDSLKPKQDDHDRENATSQHVDFRANNACNSNTSLVFTNRRWKKSSHQNYAKTINNNVSVRYSSTDSGERTSRQQQRQHCQVKQNHQWKQSNNAIITSRNSLSCNCSNITTDVVSTTTNTTELDLLIQNLNRYNLCCRDRLDKSKNPSSTDISTNIGEDILSNLAVLKKLINQINDNDTQQEVFIVLLELLKVSIQHYDLNVNSVDVLQYVIINNLQCLLLLIQLPRNGNKQQHQQHINNVMLSLTNEQSLDTIQTFCLIYHHSCQKVSTINTCFDDSSQIADIIIILLSVFVKYQVKKLPAEKTAQDVITNIFLPYLSNYDLLQQQQQLLEGVDKYDEQESTTVTPFVYICETLIELLRNHNHRSAILAPLVRDISIDNGNEDQCRNPIREKLLSILIHHLKTTGNRRQQRQQQTADLQLHVCQTLTMTVNAIRELKSSSTNECTTIKDEGVYLMKSLQDFLLNSILAAGDCETTRQLQLESLQLLNALVFCYPLAVTDIGWKLLIQDDKYSLLLLLSSSNNSIKKEYSSKDRSVISATIDLLSDFVHILPWKTWLNQQDILLSNSDRRNCIHQSRLPKSGLYRRVVAALVKIIQTIQVIYEYNGCDGCQASFQRLIKVIFIELPYCDQKIIEIGEKFWETLARTVFDSESPQLKQRSALQVLLASIGGTTTPRGELLGICQPAKTCLLEDVSFSESFLQTMIESISTSSDKAQSSFQLLSSMLRTLPDIAIRHWDSFRRLCQELIGRKPVGENVMCFKLVDAFMVGRKSFGIPSHHDEQVLELVGFVLEQSEDFQINQCHRYRLCIYAVLLDRDWAQLSRHNQIVDHFQKMLDCCHNSSSTVREGSCKTLGEFCTEYIGNLSSKTTTAESMQQASVFSDNVCTTMMNLCRDTSSSVRSMAIFALGNLTNAIRDSGRTGLLDISRLHDLCQVVINLMHDKNDKVVSNAIRCAGHTGNLLALEVHSNRCTSSCEFLNQLIDFLSKILLNSLVVGLDEEKKTVLTWKQRSATKKHGRGTCYSLGLILQEFSIACITEQLFESCCQATESLVSTQKNYRLMNEKVVLAAMVALSKIPIKLLTQIGAETEILSDALVASTMVHLDFSESNGNASLQKDSTVARLFALNDEFCLHLLQCASIQDAYHVLNNDRITRKALETLYLWMVEQPPDTVGAHAFEIFACALQRPGRFSDDVTLEQRFATRALQKHKHGSLPFHDKGNERERENVQDDIDEL